MRSFQGRLLCVFLISLFLGSAALASVGDAGCGLGSLIIDKNTKLSQSFAGTTNNWTLTQFFGISSGTSNCRASGFAVREKEAEVFAEANMQNLKVEMARGHGENLSALAQMMGCSDAAVPSFGKMTQSRYENIFPQADVTPKTMLQNVEKEMTNDSSVKQGCAVRS